MMEGWRNTRALRHTAVIGLVGALAIGVGGCSLDGLLKSNEIPPDVTDPAVTKTPEGALAVYRGTLVRFREIYASGIEGTFVGAAGLISDELQPGLYTNAPTPDPVDGRSYAQGFGGPAQPYSNLQQVRGQAQQAIGLLTDFAPPEQRPLISHMYALEGYAEMLLAELYCSGIPLSRLDYNGDYTLKPGSSTTEVLTHAAALFDTALTLAGDSARFASLAAVGKGRALLGLGQFTAAAAAVATVPDAFTYDIVYTASSSGYVNANIMQASMAFSTTWYYSVSNREGLNGLDYVSSGDPRTASTSSGALAGTSSYGYPVVVPTKYPTVTTPIPMANGVEARLVEAEAALHAGDFSGWLAKLNTLRETAIAPALADTTDPGTPEGRVDLMFRERAFWLFLTGHRQGDMRRLIRQYGRSQEEVYPIGPYPTGLGAEYGGSVYLPLPTTEQTFNPLYTQCLPASA